MTKKDDRAWDRFDRENPDIRETAKAEAAAIAKKFGPMHTREEIGAFINHNYPELGNAREVAIGVAGSSYRIAVIDRGHINHTLKIKPEEINQFLATKDRVERLSQETPHSTGRIREQERER